MDVVDADTGQVLARGIEVGVSTVIEGEVIFLGYQKNLFHDEDLLVYRERTRK